MYLNSNYNRKPEVVKEPKDYDYRGNMFLTNVESKESIEDTEDTENPSKEEITEPTGTENL
jgi:hypothetical protein